MMVKIRVSTNRVGSSDYNIIEVDDEDVLGLSDEEFDEYMGKLATDEIMSNGLIDWNWEVLDDDIVILGLDYDTIIGKSDLKELGLE